MSELSENWGQVLLTPPKKLHVPLVRVFCAFLLLLSLVQMGLESSEFQKLDTTFKVTLEASIPVSFEIGFHTKQWLFYVHLLAQMDRPCT